MAGHDSPRRPLADPARELSDLLGIIAGTTQQLENIWDGDPGSEKYLEMLRTSVGRAASITAQLVAHAGESSPAFPLTTRSLPPSAPAVSLPTRRILVVDDEPAALTLFRQLFSVTGYDVVTVRSGFECLDTLTRCDFDLVVLDYTMPFMDGEETFRRIHSIKPELPVVLSTGFIEPDRLNQMLATGLAAFLRKPLSPTELVDCVAGLLGDHRPDGEASEPRGIAAAL